MPPCYDARRKELSCIYDRSRRRSSPRRILLLFILVGIGVFLIANQNELRQQVIPPPTPTATRTAKSYVVEAESLAQTGNLKAAADAYVQAVSLEPENVEVLMTLARIMALTDRTAEAVKWAERAVQAAPQSAAAQSALALALKFHSGKLALQGRDVESDKALQQALNAAKTAVSLDPNYPEGQRLSGRSLCGGGRSRKRRRVDSKGAGAELQPIGGAARPGCRPRKSRALHRCRRSLSAGDHPSAQCGLFVSGPGARLQRHRGGARSLVVGERAGDVQERRADRSDGCAAGGRMGLDYITRWINTGMRRRFWKMPLGSIRSAWSPRSHLAATYFQRTKYEEAIDSFKQALQLMNNTFDADHYCVTAKTQSVRSVGAGLFDAGLCLSAVGAMRAGRAGRLSQGVDRASR